MITLVTGATGHVGTNLIRRLQQEGRQLRVVLAPGTDLPAGVVAEKMVGDVRDPATMAKACEGVQTVLHLAGIISITGPQGGRVHDINVNGLVTTARAALDAGVQRFVQVSSIHGFDIGVGADTPVDENAPRPGSGHPAYDRSKWEGEQRFREIIKAGLDGVIVNPTGIIGPHDPVLSRMGRFFLNLFEGRIPAALNTGFNWVDVRDVVDGILAAEKKGRTGENYILGGHWLDMQGLATLVEARTGQGKPRFTLPLWTAYLTVPFFRAMGRITGQEPLVTMESLHALKPSASRRISDKAGRELGYRPRTMEDSIDAIYRSFIEDGRLQAPADGLAQPAR